MINNLLVLFCLLNQPTESLPPDYWTFKGEKIGLHESIPWTVTNRDDDIDQWAVVNLRNGDLVHFAGESTKWGFPFGRYIKDASASKYTHTGIVEHMGGVVNVYDMDEAGLRRIRFSQYMREAIQGQICVQRLKPVYITYGDEAVGMAEDLYYDEPAFDYDFRMGNKSLYCTEFIHKIFIQQRLLLSQPVKLGDFPNIDQCVLRTFVVIAGSYVLSERPVSLDQKVYIVGNKSIGILSSKYLEIIFEGKIP